jgi:hypothetical protein
MKSSRYSFLCALAALAFTFNASYASTIIKLNLGGVGPDIGLGAPALLPPGVLGTYNDGNGTTLGDQNTDVDFESFLNFIPDIGGNAGSFTLSGLNEVGPANVIIGNVIGQSFQGGLFQLYDAGNNLLLSGPLTTSAVTGTLGPPGTGGLFTTVLGAFNGGSLVPYLQQGTVSLSINLGNINGGAGFTIPGGQIAPFLADATGSISADFSGIPEPASIMLTLVASSMLVLRRRRS